MLQLDSVASPKTVVEVGLSIDSAGWLVDSGAETVAQEELVHLLNGCLPASGDTVKQVFTGAKITDEE